MICWVVLGLFGCQSSVKEQDVLALAPSPVQIAGAMRDVMWKGKLEGVIRLDTIANKQGLYGLGPERGLQGELLIHDGQAYVSRVTSDTTMLVEATFDVSAPFFVYGNVQHWSEGPLPDSVKSVKDLEAYLVGITSGLQAPFAFKLSGTIEHAEIHVQQLPEGAAVSSPEEAHSGQVNYSLGEEAVEVVGFYSQRHQGVFTHHDAFVHMHLLTKDRRKMGHLDEVRFKDMRLYLPID